MRQLNRHVMIALSASVLVCACSSHVQTPSGLSTIPIDTTKVAVEDKTKVADASNAGGGEKFDPVADEAVSRETLKDWRIALRHDIHNGIPDDQWQKMRITDEEESMENLKDLAKQYPTNSFIKTMMGQVKQHFGKKEEAANFYEEASLQNRRDPVLLLKAAEMRRNNGETERALSYYEQVLKIQDDFPGAKLGMARCLMADKKTADEGRKMIKDMLEKNPDDKDAKAALESK